MKKLSQETKAKLFTELHHANDLLILPNAWDALSAKLFEEAGAKAIGTTSAGIAASLGFPDGEKIPKALIFMILDRIIQSVNVPVSVDIEAGFGNTIEEIIDTITQLIQLGAVGINIEDANPHQSNELYDISFQAEKIEAIKTYCQKLSFPFFVNARTDVYWQRRLPEENRLTETLNRLYAYAKAGCDGVFVPGLTDLPTIQIIASEINLPLNILGGPWITSFHSLQQANVARVSVGSLPLRTTATFISTLGKEIIEYHNFSSLENSLSYEMLNRLFE